jgi:hypothetical protein
MKVLYTPVLFVLCLGLACETPVELAPEAPVSDARALGQDAMPPVGTAHAARVNVPGCNNDDGMTDIFGPYASPPFSEEDLIFNIPIISSNCVLGAGATEHYTVLARLPQEITPPDRPVVYNAENTGLPCYASVESFNFTTDWEQRITPSGLVKLVCHFKAGD